MKYLFYPNLLPLLFLRLPASTHPPARGHRPSMEEMVSAHGLPQQGGAAGAPGVVPQDQRQWQAAAPIVDGFVDLLLGLASSDTSAETSTSSSSSRLAARPLAAAAHLHHQHEHEHSGHYHQCRWRCRLAAIVAAIASCDEHRPTVRGVGRGGRSGERSRAG